ncbi:MAG: cyclase family protein [Pygmaiobacter massiliensis]|nr:cyclase family protein [Pygmaiobacter massiliensis]
MAGLWEQLAKLKDCHWVDLTHPLKNDSPYWDGFPKGTVDLCHKIIDYDEMGFEVQTFRFMGQFGTHIDFPAHFIRGAVRSQAFSVRDMVLPLVVVDITEKLAGGPDYTVTRQDLLDFEAKHGRIPAGSFVALRTDWSKRWPDGDALDNKDAEGAAHFPGWGMEAVTFLATERQVAAIGHETLDTDSAEESAKAGDLACERYWLGQGKFQLEAMANLDQLPATGAVIVIGSIPVENANGMPVRAFAVFE